MCGDAFTFRDGLRKNICRGMRKDAGRDVIKDARIHYLNPGEHQRRTKLSRIEYGGRHPGKASHEPIAGFDAAKTLMGHIASQYHRSQRFCPPMRLDRSA